MVRDFGPGLSVDELIGMPAWHIDNLELPPGEVFETAQRAAELLVQNNLESTILAELWEDGHTVWQDLQNSRPVVVTSTGQVIRSRN